MYAVRCRNISEQEIHKRQEDEEAPGKKQEAKVVVVMVVGDVQVVDRKKGIVEEMGKEKGKGKQ